MGEQATPKKVNLDFSDICILTYYIDQGEPSKGQ